MLKALHNQAPSQVAMITQLLAATDYLSHEIQETLLWVWPRRVNYAVQTQSLSIHLEIFSTDSLLQEKGIILYNLLV